MSLFDRFMSKIKDVQKEEAISAVPPINTFSKLAAAAEEAKERYSDDVKTVDNFFWALREHRRVRSNQAQDEQQPMKAEARFFLSTDRMNAYACLFPPENDGEEITLEEFLEDMHYEGVSYGILSEEIEREFEFGYFNIFRVAQGRNPEPGEDGKVTELFQRRKNMRLEVQNGSEVDFNQENPLQPIRKGAAICLIQAPKAGTDGVDVTGRPLASPEVVSAPVPQGKNTEIDKAGQALVASVDGILYMEDGRFCIHEQQVIDRDLDQFHGTLQVSGNLYISGNVDGGGVVTASGDIVINGKIGKARVTSTEGTIRVQQGVYGTKGETFLSSAAQVQSPVIEWAEIAAGTSVITEAIMNSTVRCGGVVYAMSGRGLITDSVIQAQDSIMCLRLGNLAGGRNQFSVGYPTGIPESWVQITAQLAEVQATIDKLWEATTVMRRKSARLSDKEKQLLEQLLEQRQLYTEKREALTVELQYLDQVLSKKSKGRVRCEKLYPFLDIRIGRLAEEIISIEEDCNIHVEDRKICLK